MKIDVHLEKDIYKKLNKLLVVSFSLEPVSCPCVNRYAPVLSFCLSICPFVYLSVHLYVCMSIHLSHCRVYSLYNPVPPIVLMDLFQTLYAYC